MEIFLPWSKIYTFSGILLGVCITVIIAIIMDLWDGVYTAQQTNVRIHSHKLRMTIDKMSEYWRFIVIGFLIDCIGALFDFYILPFVVIAFGLGLLFVEVKSMFEHAKRRKSHVSDMPKLLQQIVDCATTKDAKKIVELLNEKQTSDGDNT